ncbi:MAG: hypothetical protein NT002_00520 [candidate division Zixibacteria bacterium]|nr:hypothetical protein [candidate division Zixibacteria bacterium]
MILAKNQHIFKRQNTAITQNGPKTAGHPKQKTGHPAQNRVTYSQLFWVYFLTPLALYFIIVIVGQELYAPDTIVSGLQETRPTIKLNHRPNETVHFKNRRNKPNLPAHHLPPNPLSGNK